MKTTLTKFSENFEIKQDIITYLEKLFKVTKKYVKYTYRVIFFF
jgi:hypothetical protein